MGGFFRRTARAAALLLLAVFLLCACAPQGNEGLESMVADNASAGTGEGTSAGAQIALITTEARLESTLGQNIWSTVSRFAGEKGYTSDYYKAEPDDAEAALATLELAVRGGAVLVVTMDEAVTEAVSAVTSSHPETRFILLDAPAGYEPLPSCMVLTYSAAQAGWLAGYVALYEQPDTLGLLQAGDDRSAALAMGFALGAEYAAAERGMAPASVRLAWSDPRQATGTPAERAAELYAGGASLVYAAVPPALQPQAAEAAQAANAANPASGKLIGTVADVQGGGMLAGISFDPKALLYDVLEDWGAGSFPAGQVIEGGVADGSLQLVVESSRFTNARAWILNQPALRFEDGSLAEQLAATLTGGPEGAVPLVDELALAYLTVTPPALPEPPPPVVSGSGGDSSTEGGDDSPAGQPADGTVPDEGLPEGGEAGQSGEPGA